MDEEGDTKTPSPSKDDPAAYKA